MSDCLLPEEVVEEILHRLSSKSLIRFKGVCKAWCSLISCPKFLSKHLLPCNSYEYEKKKLLVRRRPKNTNTNHHHLSFLSDPSKSRPLPLPDSPPPDYIPRDWPNSYDIEILGPCNGLMCFYSYITHSYSTSHILLWNFVDDKIKVVPKPNFPSPPGTIGSKGDLGFGYDTHTGDYKLVKITLLWRDDESGPTLQHKVEIYSLKSNTWQGAIHAFPPCRDPRRPVLSDSELPPGLYATHYSPHIVSEAPFHAHSAYVNGVVSWTCYSNRFMWFRISDESFGFTLYPSVTEIDSTVIRAKSRNAPVNPEDWKHTLFALNDTKIALVVDEDDYRDTEKYFHIWVLLDFDVQDSWIRWLTIGPFEMIQRPLWFFKNDQIIMETYEGELVLCNPFTRETESLNICGVPGALQIISIEEKYNFFIS